MSNRSQNLDMLLRFIKFGLVGASGVVVNLGIYFVLTRLLGAGDTLWGRNLSYGLSVELSILSNFLLNDLWTFRDRRESKPLVRLYRFHLVSLVGFAINWGFFAGLNYLLHLTGGTMLGEVTVAGRNLGNVDDLMAACLGIAAAMFWNFFGNMLWTWKNNGTN